MFLKSKTIQPEQEKKEIKIVVFSGLEKSDFTYYVARIGAAITKKVLVVDNSVSHSFYRIIQKEDNEEDIIQTQGFWLIKDIVYSEKFFENFDVVLVFAGRNTDASYLDHAAAVIVSFSYGKIERNEIVAECFQKEELKYPEEKTFVICRDKVCKKIHENIIIHEANIKPAAVFPVALDVSDEVKYEALQENGSQSMKGLSDALAFAVAEVAMRTYHIDEKQYKKAIR